MKSAFFEVDNFPHNFGGLVWIKWITGESNVWFVQVVQSGEMGESWRKSCGKRMLERERVGRMGRRKNI